MLKVVLVNENNFFFGKISTYRLQNVITYY